MRLRLVAAALALSLVGAGPALSAPRVVAAKDKPAPAPAPAPPKGQDGDSVSPFGTAGRDPNGGFFLESKPRISTVFGDTTSYKRVVDRFLTVHDEMQAVRGDFSKNVQSILVSLQGHKAVDRGKGGCPADAVSLPYLRAFRLGQRYHELGKELELAHARIVDLDDLGETAGLTPDYRWKVARSLKLFKAVLTDFQEMRVAFQDQLGSELAHFKCVQSELIVKGEAMEKEGLEVATPTPVQPALPRSMRDDVNTPPVYASSATFFVDNASCPKPLSVYLDTQLMGEVGGKTKAAFRTSVGRHSLCLIPVGSGSRCGDPGTLRKSYIHDGWSIALRCD